MSSLFVGEHPTHMTVVVVQGSTADLVVPADTGALSAPVLEFTANRSGEPSVTHTLALESGEWVVHLSSVQVAALAGLHFARVKDSGRVVAAGQVQHNPGWYGRSESRVVTTRIIWGGVTDHGALTGLTDDGHPQYALADGTRGNFAPTDHGHALADISDYTAMHGTGSPLGVVSAPPGTKYIDEVGTLGAWEWLKKSGTGNTGWEVIHGDTGPRMIPSSMLENGWTHGDSNNGLILRRINAEVFFASNYVGGASTLENTNATNVRFLTLPDGFRKLPSANFSTVGFARVTSANGALLTDPAHGMAISGGGAQGPVTFNVAWTTTDPWPTVLPGVPA